MLFFFPTNPRNFLLKYFDPLPFQKQNDPRIVCLSIIAVPNTGFAKVSRALGQGLAVCALVDLGGQADSRRLWQYAVQTFGVGKPGGFCAWVPVASGLGYPGENQQKNRNR